MKKILTNIIRVALAVFAVSMFAGCQALENSLSSEQSSDVKKATGSMSVASSSWYYNGSASTNMSGCVAADSNTYEQHSIKLNFGKKAAISSGGLTGYVDLTYTDANGCSSTKRYTGLTGTFSSDYESYNLNLNNILNVFNAVENPTGEGTIEIKIDGFLCAEGDQSGRPISAFDKKVAVEPLYDDTSIDYSTCWCTSGEAIQFPLNAECSLTGDSSVYSIADSITGLTYAVSVSGSNLLFTPNGNLNSVTGKTLAFTVYGILPVSGGNSYNKTLSVNLVKNAIVIDGLKDVNYSNTTHAVSVTDETGDQSALGYTTSMGDIQGISILNDKDYLYVGVSGDLTVTWKDRIVLMINKSGNTTDSTASSYKPAANVAYKNGKPTVYLYHQPGSENTGSGSWGCRANLSDITSAISLAPQGWTSTTTGTFTEYAIPLSNAGFSSGDTLKIIACLTLDWSEGIAVCDIVPSNAYSTYSSQGTNVIFDFSKAIDYTIE